MFANLMSKIRGKMFWFFDQLEGGKIKQAYEELKRYDQIDSCSSELSAYQKAAIQNLLQHAIETTDYYSYYDKDKLNLEHFPVVNKNIIKSQQERFMSCAFKKKALTVMTTSGSTGTPFVCYQDNLKKMRVNAEIIYYSEKVGYTVGKSLIILRAVVDESKKSKLSQWIKNIRIIDVSNINDDIIKKLLAKIAKISKNGSILLAYASTYDFLCDYFQRKGLDNKCNIYGMISSSEILIDETRAIMEDAFICKCVSRYSNQENGVIGQDNSENNVFFLNEAHYIVEVIEIYSDIPVEQGKIGRIVVTDLYNYAMPMIRYDTGDVGSIIYFNIKGINKKAICNFSGREIDLVYDSTGNCLSPHKISVIFRCFFELKQFQFIQKSENSYLVKLIVDESFSKQDQLEAKLLNLLGDKAIINFEYVYEIPMLSSGKRNYIFNTMAKGKV